MFVPKKKGYENEKSGLLRLGGQVSSLRDRLDLQQNK